MDSAQAKFFFIISLIWLPFGFSLPLHAQTPYLNYETVSGATVNSPDPTFNNQSYNQRSVLGNLAVPVIHNNDYILGPGISFAQTSSQWTGGFSPDKAFKERSYTVLSLYAMQQGETRMVQGFFVYAQRRDLSFTFPRPMHEVSLGGAIKHSFLDGVIPAGRAGRLYLGVIVRHFPGVDRFIPYFAQTITIADKEISIEYPGTISYTYKVAKTNERYKVAMVIDDVPLTPRTLEDHTRIWGVDSYRISFLGSYEKQIWAPVVLAASGGAIMEKLGDFDLSGKPWHTYSTALAPYFRIGITAWL